MHHGKRLTGVLLLVLLLAVHPTRAQNAEEIFSKGCELYQAGSYAQAISYFEKAAQTPALQASAILYQARCWHRLGKYPAALALYKERLAAEPGNLDVLYERARTYMQLNQWQDALADLNQVDIAYPQNVFVSYARGVCFQALQQLNEAEAMYRAALRLRPAFGRAHQKIGETLLAAGKPDDAMKCFAEAANYKDIDAEQLYFCQAKIYEARQDFAAAADYLQKSVTLNNKNVQAWQLLGDLYFKQKEYNKALDAYNSALPMLKNNKGDLHRVRATILYQLQRYEEAVAEFAKAAQQGVADVELHYFWGCSLANANQADAALEHLEQVIRLQAKYWDAYFQCARIYQKKGQYGAAIRYYNELQDLGYRGYDLHFGLAEAQQKLKDYDKALLNYTEAIKLNPKYADAYVRRSEVRMQKSAFPSALDDMNQAINMSPQAVYYKQRGLLYARLGKYQEALKDIGKAIELEPQNHLFYHQRGIVLMEEKSVDEAIADFNEVIKRKPDYGEAYYRRAQCYAILARDKNALKDFDKAVELLPKDAWVHYYRGVQRKKIGHWESALQDFTNAASLEAVAVFFASQAEVLLEIGKNTASQQERRDKFEKAQQSATRALELDPNQKKYYLLRADIYTQQGKEREATDDRNVAKNLTSKEE